MQNTFSILFYLRKNRPNKDGKCAIMVRVTVSGELSQFSSKLTADPALWDAANSRVKGRSATANDTNRQLDEIKASLITLYREIERRDGIVTPEKVRNAYCGFEEKTETVIAVYMRYLANAYKLVGISKTLVTVKTYERCCNRLEAFIQKCYKRSDMAFRELNYEFLVDFESYLRRDCKCSTNTAAKYMQLFRMIVIYVKNNGISLDSSVVDHANFVILSSL